MQIVWEPPQADFASLIPSIRYVARSTNWWRESALGGKTGSSISTKEGSLSLCLPAWRTWWRLMHSIASLRAGPRFVWMILWNFGVLSTGSERLIREPRMC